MTQEEQRETLLSQSVHSALLEDLTGHMENVQSATSAASEAIRERYFPTNAMPMWVGETT